MVQFTVEVIATVIERGEAGPCEVEPNGSTASCSARLWTHAYHGIAGRVGCLHFIDVAADTFP